MKERPILFNGDMVRAILDGRKTQTRRVVTDAHFRKLGLERDGKFVYTTEGPQWNGDFEGSFWCPFGEVGSKLWVRETCRAEELSDGTDGVRYLADNSFKVIENTLEASEDWIAMNHYRTGCGEIKGQVVPSIHMPRWASRITLEITGVRVERLHSISNEEIVREGFNAVSEPVLMPDDSFAVVGEFEGKRSTLRSLFSSKWTEINGPGSWDANPWVWVVEFTQLKGSESC